MKRYTKSLFIFRRDLRLEDNTGLNAVLEQSKIIIPCFIFDSRQIGIKNTYKSDNALAFMIESLYDLADHCSQKGGRLYILNGQPDEVVSDLIKNVSIDAVFVNKDYTPFSIKRDEAIEKVCRSHEVAFNSYADALLHEPERVTSASGTPYMLFTPFWKKSRTLAVERPTTLRVATKQFYTGTLKGSQQLATIEKTLKLNPSPLREIIGGHTKGITLLKRINSFTNYSEIRDIPALKTTHLSAHLKFGTISIREAFYAIEDTLSKDHPLSRQLYWRDFYTHIAYFSPFVFGQPMREKYKKIKWNTSKHMFQRWCDGTTGFPIVDAGIRELNQTGYIHNRIRMIVASFLIKDLHINWLWGEKYFAQKLVDYDPAVNNGNWQWCASTGADAQPYFRIFNPWLQQKKFDPDCVYIKKWVPELKQVDTKVIHSLFKGDHTIKNYPMPIVEHEVEAKKSLYAYRHLVK